jgi:hypothetical protein
VAHCSDSTHYSAENCCYNRPRNGKMPGTGVLSVIAGAR